MASSTMARQRASAMQALQRLLPAPGVAPASANHRTTMITHARREASSFGARWCGRPLTNATTVMVSIYATATVAADSWTSGVRIEPVMTHCVNGAVMSSVRSWHLKILLPAYGLTARNWKYVLATHGSVRERFRVTTMTFLRAIHFSVAVTERVVFYHDQISTASQ